jgi:hypothetical protein
MMTPFDRTLPSRPMPPGRLVDGPPAALLLAARLRVVLPREVAQLALQLVVAGQA